MTDTSFAPGCFGSALTFKATSKVCAACPFVGACQPLSEARLAALREKFGIKDRPKLSKFDREVEGIVTAVRDFDVPGHLKHGANPFEGTQHVWLRVACHMLLNVSGGLMMKSLAKAFEANSKWTRATAATHAKMAVKVLVTLGAAIETDGKIVINQE